MIDEKPEAQKLRSKRLYVYWGVALALLLALGLICWLVVVPAVRKWSETRRDSRWDGGILLRAQFMQERRKFIMQGNSKPELSDYVDKFLGAVGDSPGRDYVAASIDGEVYVAEVPRDGEHRVCIMASDGTVAFEKPDSARIQRVLREGKKVRQAAAEALKEIRGEEQK